MQRDVPFLNGETYHIYNRGANKADIFLNESDYSRFQILLFLGNHTNKPFRLDDLVRKYKSKDSPQGRSLRRALFQEEQPDLGLVDILSYALMPNHFHLILRQKIENGVTQFMKKLGTAYSMYFNMKHEHSGTVFQGRFKSRHVSNEEYLRWLFAYVALNPLDIQFPKWKEQGVASPAEAQAFLESYLHASYPDISGRVSRPEGKLIAHDAFLELGEAVPNFSNLHELIRIESVRPI